jgi:Domain of unknown function (DUF1996)
MTYMIQIGNEPVHTLKVLQRPSATVPLLLAALMSACGVGASGDESATPTSAPAPAPTPNQPAAPAPAPAAGPAVDVTRIPTGTSGSSTDLVRATGELPGPAPGGTGAFRTVCDFSHMAFDDPIVFPGQPGKSHLHAFFGNTGVNAASTAASIQTTGNSTCRGGTINRSAYWAPAMVDTRDGAPVKPTQAIIYYKVGANGIPGPSINSLPQSLRMIAGDSKNSTAIAHGPALFKCIDDVTGSGPAATPGIPNCGIGTALWQSIEFPQCWDGVNLDSPDHKSHMAYPRGNRCPATHPVAVPVITINVVYKITEPNAPLRWRLASDAYDHGLPAGYSSHADWFNGWRPEIMDTWVKKCDQVDRECMAHLLGDGRMMTGVGT